MKYVIKVTGINGDVGCIQVNNKLCLIFRLLFISFKGSKCFSKIKEISIFPKINSSKFGTFDLNRQLTDYETEHFDNFMKLGEYKDIRPVSEVSLTNSVNDTLSDLEKQLGK